MKKNRALNIAGSIWSSSPFLKVFDKLYESRYISFYEPRLKGEIDKEKIILFNEKFKNPILWPFKIFKILKRTYKIFKVIKEFKPDLVITHHDDANISIIPTLLICKFLKNTNIKFYAFIHAGAEQYNTKDLYTRLIKFIIKNFYKYFDKVYTVSRGNKKLLKRYFNLQNLDVFYLPIDINKYQQLSNEPLEKEYQNIFKNSFVFINIGRLTEAKGQWFLIRAFKKVAEKYLNAKLIILGDGELKDKLQELINKLNLQNNVYLLGIQENPFKFLKHSNCFVFPSLWESWGQVLVESLTLNLPVISTDCKTGPREILCPELDIDAKIDYPYYGKYGILTKPFPREYIWKSLDERPLIEEEKMLAELMIKMIEDEELRKKYSNGLERAKDFDVEKIIKKWEKL